MEEELKICTLGKFELKSNDVNITEGIKLESKRWELFQYLVTNKHRSISQEEIISVLGLDENSDPVGSLSSLVYRLRNTLKEAIGSQAGDYIRRSGNAYTFNVEKSFWLDIDEFEKACELTNKAIEDNSDDWQESFEQILNLYQGDYLEEAHLCDWVWNARNYYTNQLVSTFNKLAEHLTHQNKYEELWDYYTKVNQLIGFDEDLMFGMIETLLRMGKVGFAHQKLEELIEFFEENDLIIPLKIKVLKSKFPKTNSDNPGLVLEEIKQSLEEEKAYICPPETFTDIFRLEIRRSSRESPPRFLSFFRIDGDYDETILKKVGNNLFEMITKQLRSGDIICRWNNKQIIALLTGLDESEIEKVMKRLYNSFYYLYNIPEEIELKKYFSEIEGKSKK